MKKLLLLLLLGCGVGYSQPSNFDVYYVGPTSICAQYTVNNASATQHRIAYGTTNGTSSADLTWWHDRASSNSGSGTRTDCIVGIDPNSTIYFQPQSCQTTCGTYSNWNNNYDCNTDSGKSLQEDAEYGTETVTCEAGTGVLSFTMSNPADPWEVAAPSLDFTDPDNWTTAGVYDTIGASEALTDVRTALLNCRSASTGTGDFNDIEVSWRFDDTGELVYNYSWSNPKHCRIVSDRWDTPHCAPDNVITDPGFDDYCLPNFANSSFDAEGFVGGNYASTKGTLLEHIYMDMPDWSDGAFDEGETISSIAVQDGTTIRVTTSAAHGIVNGGDPPFVIVAYGKKDAGCPNSAPECWLDEVNGTFDYNVIDTTNIDLTVTDSSVYGDYVANSAFLTQDEATINNQLFGANNQAFMGGRHLVIDNGWPYKYQSIAAALGGGGEMYFSDIYIQRWGNQFGIDPGTTTTDCGSSGGCDTGFNVSQGFHVYADSAKWENIRAQGNGIGFGFTDVFQNNGTDYVWNHIATTVPDCFTDAYNDGSCGTEDLTRPASRHGPGFEYKAIKRMQMDGVLIAGGLDAVAGQTTENWPVFLRSLGANGTNDVEISNIWIHGTPYAVNIDACWDNLTSRCPPGHPVKLSNIAHVEYDLRQETGTDVNVDSSGGFLQLGYGTQVELDGGLSYSSDATDADYGPFTWFNGRGALKVTNFIGFAWNNWENDLFWDSGGVGGSTQSPDPDGQVGGVQWDRAFGDFGTISSWDSNTFIGWCETTDCALTSDTDGTTVTESEMAADDSSSWTNMTYIGIATESLSARLTELALSNNYEVTGSTPGSATGIDYQQHRDKIGVLEPCSGTDSIVTPSAGDGTLSFCTNLPTGSTRTFYVDVYGPNWSIEGPEGTAANAVDITGNTHPTNDTITRNDGGDWEQEHFCFSGAEIELWGSLTAGNDGRYAVDSCTSTVLTVTAIGGGDAGLTTQTDDTGVTIQADPERKSTSGNGADVTVTFTGLTNMVYYKWRANATDIPFGWIRDETRIKTQ